NDVAEPPPQFCAQLRVRESSPSRLAIPTPLPAHVKHAVLAETDEQEHGRICRAVVNADVVVLDRRERLYDVNVGVKHIVHDAFGQNPLPENETSVPKARVLALERFDVLRVEVRVVVETERPVAQIQFMCPVEVIFPE